MADLSVDPYGMHEPRARRRRSAMSLAAGAAVSALALLAAGLWVQGLATRDASEIPFLRADGGPMKVQPDDPGGLKMGEVDGAVTRMLGGDGDGTAVALAPQDEGPAPEDLPAARLERSVDVASLGDPAEMRATDERLGAAPAAGPFDGRAIDDAVEQALEEAPAQPSGSAEPRLIEATPRAPSRSPVAATRPARGAAAAPAQVASAAPAAQSPAATAAEAPSAAPASAGALVAGAQAVQLGAFNTEAIAADQWRRHQRRNGDLLSGFAHAVTTVRSGGRTLYRLRVGPVASRDRAQELCAALEGRGDACIPVRVR